MRIAARKIVQISLVTLLCVWMECESARASVAIADFPSLQAAIDANPGVMLFLPAGEHPIASAVRITTLGAGLYGPGTIVQTNPEASIIEIANTENVRIQDITLTRSEGNKDSTVHGIHVVNSGDVHIQGVRVVDNRSQAGTIYLERCRASLVCECTVLNYKRITVDDRTSSDLYGYAFKVIDGTGILVTQGSDISITDNQVVDTNLLPTPEIKEKYHLGSLTEGKLPTKKGRLAPAGDYANNWHQGSAIVVTSPEETSHVLISGNTIRNAAQGIDIHADHVTCTGNVIAYAFVGVKCMHGSKNVIITGNNVSHMDLWGLIMMPGTASHPAEATNGDKPARGANVTSGNIIANNIFSDFGFGHEYFNWKNQKSGVISLESGQLAENPVMTDVIISGNIVYDTGKDKIMENGLPVSDGPRYEYAVYITPDPRPQGLHFSNNVFHPGRGGVSNVELAP